MFVPLPYLPSSFNFKKILQSKNNFHTPWPGWVGTTRMNGYTVEKWEREENSSSCVWRDRTEIRQRWGTGSCERPMLPRGVMWCPLRAISSSVALPQKGVWVDVHGSLLPRAIQMPKVWTTIRGHVDVHVQGRCCLQGHTNLEGLRCHSEVRCCLGWTEWGPGPCLGSWPYCSWHLCWCPWPVLPPGAIGELTPVTLAPDNWSQPSMALGELLPFTTTTVGELAPPFTI